MRVTINWLKRFLNTDASTLEICDTLTSLGFEVEEVIDRAKDFEGFIVAEVISTEQHPNADRLRLCKVNTGSETLEIVCGAPNARAGIKVALAQVGCIIPNGKFKITKSKIRGVYSNGMLCSYEELNIDPPQDKKDFDGIIELDSSSVVGESLAKYLGFDDNAIEISVTPNRGDALSVLGLARELVAGKIATHKEWCLREIDECGINDIEVNNREINKNQANKNEANKNDTNKSKIKFKKSNFGVTKDSCSQIYFIKIDKIKNQESPKWIKNYLQNVGIKSISAVVDIVNYVSHSLGQPMHAYDAAKILSKVSDLDSYVSSVSDSSSIMNSSTLSDIDVSSDLGSDTINLNDNTKSEENIWPNLKVDFAIGGEEILALDNKSYKLSGGDIVIRDFRGSPQAIAGIIGSLGSGCTIETSSIILESAVFDPIKIFKTGSRLNIYTDSRMRFERGVDSNMSMDAIVEAANLIKEICGGEIVGYYCDGPSDAEEQKKEQDESRKLKSIKISAAFIEKKLGTKIDTEIKAHITEAETKTDIDSNNNTKLKLDLKKIIEILTDLKFDVISEYDAIRENVYQKQDGAQKQDEYEIEVLVPSFRYDIKIKEDIVEEIARVIGYDNLASAKLEQEIRPMALARHQKNAILSRRILASLGYNEVITWSFMERAKSQLFFDTKDELMLSNPISSNLNYMRETILPNLLDIVSKSNERSIRDVEIFEIGPVFGGNKLVSEENSDLKKEPEPTVIAGIRTSVDKNKYYFRHGGNNKVYSSDLPDFYIMKGDIEVLLSELGVDLEEESFEISDVDIPSYYHQKRAAAFLQKVKRGSGFNIDMSKERCKIEKKLIGYFGQINPKICKEFGIKDDVFGFEIFLNEITVDYEKENNPFNNYQTIERDFCFVIDKKKCKVGEVLKFIKDINKILITKVELFDIYESNNELSIAVKVFIQPNTDSFSGEDITELYSKIIDETEKKFECKLKR